MLENYLYNSSVTNGISTTLDSTITHTFAKNNTINPTQNVNTLGIHRNKDLVARCITYLPTNPSNGILWEIGGTGDGCWLGFRDNGTYLRFRAGDGSVNYGTGNIVSTDYMAACDIPTTDLSKYLNNDYHEIVWEIRIGGNSNSGNGRVRLWIDGDLIGSSITTGTNTSIGKSTPLQISGTDQGGFCKYTGVVCSGEHTTPWSYDITGNMEYYADHLLSDNTDLGGLQLPPPCSLNKIATFTSNNLTDSITNITEQLNTIPNKITGTFENALNNDLTPNKILLTDETGKLIESAATVTSTELEYLKGLSSSIKTQLINTSNYAKTVSNNTVSILDGVNTDFAVSNSTGATPLITENGVANQQPIQINDTDYYYYAFTSTTGNHSIAFNEDTECDILLVGGGGAGGRDTGGGGGGGEVLYYTNYDFTFKTGDSLILNGSYNITIGNGGNNYGTAGSNSKISMNNTDIIVAGGGGGGGTAHANNLVLNSTGGGGGGNSGNSVNKNGTSSITGGGKGGTSINQCGGGGGGGAKISDIAKNGGNATSSVTGSGGIGVDVYITGNMLGVGGGGSGGNWDGGKTPGTVSHGGGSGGIYVTNPKSGTPNTGGGGGGTGLNGRGLGSGGSGTVIIRWKKQPPSEIAIFSNKLLEELSTVTLDDIITTNIASSIKYPRENMTSNSKTYTDGTVVQVKASSQWNGSDHAAYSSFNGNTTDYGWGTSNGVYNSSGNASTTYLTGYSGEWLMMDLGESIILGNFKLYPRSGYNSRMPRTFRLYASTNSNVYTNGVNDNKWNLIFSYSDTNTTNTNTPVTHHITNNTTSYRYYFIVVNQLYQTGQNGMVQFAEMELYSKASTRKLIENNTYEGNLNINGKLTVSNDMLISGASANLFSTSFTQESLEINATSSDSLLDIKKSGSGNILEFQSGGVPKVTVSYNGNVGIGKTDPSSMLDVVGNVNATTGYNINGSALSYNDIANKPTEFNHVSHTHTISNITNLQTSLDNKQPNIPVMSYNSGTNTITVDADVVLTANKTYKINGTDILENADYVTGTSGGGTSTTTTSTTEDNYWKQRTSSMPVILDNNSSVSAKQINNHTYYYDFTNTCKYPRENMSAASKTYADGTVVQVKASTQYDTATNSTWSSFNGITNDDGGWATTNSTYTANTGNAVNTSLTGYAGEWLMIDLGESIILHSFKLFCRLNLCKRMPRKFRLYGAINSAAYTDVNNSNWNLIYEYYDSLNNSTNENPVYHSLKGNEQPYRYYFIVINQIYIDANSILAQIAEIEFYAKRHSITFSKDTYCDVLLIGGGGSGGCGQSGAGGGSGECRYIQNHLFTSGTYNIIVGKGGASRTRFGGLGNKGDDSYIVKSGSTEDFLRAYGGGAGGQGTSTDTTTIVGGSSGGVGTKITVYSPDPSGNMKGYANKGGTGINNVGGFYAGGGGGGSGSAGGDALYFSGPSSICYAGQGGYGVKLDITGEDKYYAAGGGGSISSGNYNSKNVLGIGGGENQAGVDGTGSGGGGTYASSGISGKGGNGTVIIRWNNFGIDKHVLYNNLEIYNNNIVIEKQKYFNNIVKYGDIQIYPPGAMTANTTTLSGYSYGNGKYIVSASSVYGGSAGDVWNLFDFTEISMCNSLHDRYDVTTGSSNANTAILEGTNYVGEWIKIQMPQQIYLHHIKFVPRTKGEGLLSRSPNKYRIYASNDGNKWKMLLDNVNTAIYHTEKESNYHNTEIPYLQSNDKYFYFAICVNSVYGGDSYSIYLNINEVKIYGSESFVNLDNSNSIASLQKSVVVGEGNVVLYNGNIQANTMNANHCTIKNKLNVNKNTKPYQKYPKLQNHTLSNPTSLEYKFTYTDGTPNFKFKVSSQNSGNGYHNWSIDKSFDGIFNGSIANWTITGWTTAAGAYTSGNAVNTYKTGYAGEWLIYDIGVSKTLKQVKIYPFNYPSTLMWSTNRQPKAFCIYASNTSTAYSNINDVSWVHIYQGYNIYTDAYVKTYDIINNVDYQYYCIVFNEKVNSTDGDQHISINELEFYYEIKENADNYVERYPKMYNDLYLKRSIDSSMASSISREAYVSSKAYKYTYSNSLNKYPTFRFQCSDYRTDWSTGVPCFYCFDEYLQHDDNTTIENNRIYGWSSSAYYTNQLTINGINHRQYTGTTEHITGYKGEWIMFDMGIPKNLKQIVFAVGGYFSARQPAEFKLYGSNNHNAYRTFNTYPTRFTTVGTNIYKVGEGNNDGWEKIYDGYNTINSASKKSYGFYENIKYYQYYLIIVNKTLQGDSFMTILEIELYTALDMITTSWNIEGDVVNDLTFSLTDRQNEKYLICEFDGSKTNTGQYTNFTGVHHCKTENKELYSKKYTGYIVSSQNKYQKMNSIYSPENIQRNMDNEMWDYLPIVDLSRKTNDKNTFGVICKIEDENSTKRYINTGYLTHYYDKREHDRRLHIAGVGEGGIWICDCNGRLEAGDYITTSPIPGIGMKQSDDIQHNYTVAKITMDCDFNPQKIELKKLNDNGEYENVYDDNGNIVFEYQYETKHIKENGEIIDDIGAYYTSLYESIQEPEIIHLIAFVGCSYNCS